MDDVKILGETCDYIFGLPSTTGDPSPFTARGVLEGMRAAIDYKYNDGNFDGLKVAVQGIGNVGMNLCELLTKEGAALIIADPDQFRLDIAKDKYNADVVGLNEIYSQDVDIFAPCAIGATLNSSTITKIRAPIIAGAANNQLKGTEVGI